MKRLIRAVAWMGMIALIAFSPFWAASLMTEKENLIQKQFDSWTGVLRVWKCEGWQSGNGSMDNWLNACIASFEKKNPGVYVQITDVSEETLRSLADGNVNPPDMILYAPGMLDAPYSLMELSDEYDLMKSLQNVGRWQEARYAVPVALGGYGLAINSQLLAQTPSDWSVQTLPIIRGKNSKSTQTADLLNAPKDENARCWSAAILSLFAGSSAKEGEYMPAPVGDGIDLGLPIEEAEEEKPTEVVEYIPNSLPAVLPENFRIQNSVYSTFTAGQLAAMPVTQRELRRLELLGDSGKAPDWRVEAIGLPFTDQIMLASVIAWDRSDIQERQALCLKWIEMMLSESFQQKLTASRAFSVTDIAPIYSNNRAMSILETALKSPQLHTPPAFGNQWRRDASTLMDGVKAGGQTQEAYRIFCQLLDGV